MIQIEVHNLKVKSDGNEENLEEQVLTDISV
jgi:hypothetical protein